jgi:hypothetical protein
VAEDINEDRAAYDEAIETGRYADAYRAQFMSLWKRAQRILLKDGLILEWHRTPMSALDMAASFVSAMDDVLARESERASYKWKPVRDAFAAMTTVQAFLEGRLPVENDEDRVGRLLICGAALGYAEFQLVLIEIGHWESYSRAKSAYDRIAKASRDRLAPWLKAFAPIARAYCAGRSKVTLGQLRGQAREWASGPRAPGQNWQLPADDKSLNTGFKKLVRLGLLTIPGRQSQA